VAHEIKVFNNLSRSKESFKPIQAGKVSFYSCGPTTYDFLHVGNARALVVGDLINRIFKVLDYDVTFVRNFTDVDDKIIERANELKVKALDHAQQYVDEALADMNSLGMLPADHTPKVSDTMPEIIQMVETLIAKGFAYEVDGEVLYHVPKFKEYGKLSKVELESLQHGVRVEVDQKKKHPSDFVLWKPAKPGEPSWDSPWGKGRPGWHIECSAMSKKFLGESFDLHHGGIDLMFPHHENEIAQSEAANGCQFSTCWVHNEFLNFGNEKMSKSLGNVVTIRKFVEEFGGEILRHMLASVHYRSKMDWSEDVIRRALDETERLHTFALEVKGFEQGDHEAALSELEGYIPKMKEELANDFNIPTATLAFYSFMKTINREYQGKKPSAKALSVIKETVEFFTLATGLIHADAQAVLGKVNAAKGKLSGQAGKLDAAAIEQLIKDRAEARASKNWGRADEIRDQFKAAGIVLKDNPDGTVSWSYE